MANTASRIFETSARRNGAAKMTRVYMIRSERRCLLRMALLATLVLSGVSLSFAGEGSVRTLDGKSFEGEIRFNDHGAVVVKPFEGEPATIELKNVARATFAPGQFLAAGSLLPNGWTLQDIGETRGMTRLDGNIFSFRVESQTTNATACHFVHRPMPSDGEITARVDHVGGSSASFAGVMIRSTSSSSIFVSLSRGSDGKLWFHRRLSDDRKDIRLTAGATVGDAPVWLRLQKRDKQVIASHSADGKKWQPVGSDSIKMPLEKTWREHEGELHLLRASIGVFAASRGKETVCIARVAEVALSLNGMLGEYFGNQQFRNLRFARLDPQIKFDWKLGSPEPSLAKDDFSVRWTGRLLAPKSGEYRFYFEAEGGGRLWVGEQEVPGAGLKRTERRVVPPPVALTAGKPVDLRVEFDEDDGPAAVKLSWTFPNQHTPEVIPMTNFLSRFDATNSPESVMASRATNDMPVVRGVWLRDGSFVAGPVAFGDESAIRLSFAGRKDVAVLNSKVAQIVLRPPRQRLPFEIASGRRGLFLKNGDFFESEFRRIEPGSVSMSSVLFGLKRFWIEGGEPVTVVLNDYIPMIAPFRVRLLDGSLFCTTTLSADADSLTLEEPLLGRLSIPTSELFQIESVRSADEAAAPR